MLSQFALLLTLATTGMLPPRPPGALVALGPPLGAVITRAERGRYHLFPGIDSFASCRVYRQDSGFVALVLIGHPAAPKPVLLPLSNRDLDRLQAIVASPRALRDLPGADSVIAGFWQRVESGVAAPEPLGAPGRSLEGTVRMTSAGMAIGGALGGFVGSQAGITQVSHGNCVAGYSSSYALTPGTFCTVSGLTAGVVTAAGYLGGLALDTRQPERKRLPGEGNDARTCCAIGAAVPGLAAGALVLGLLYSSLYGRDLNWDGTFGSGEDDLLAALPAICAGIGVTVEIVHLGYLLGRKIDRDRARRARAELPGD